MIITNEQRIKDLADAIVMRTHEVYYYDTNIANYEAIIATTNGEYPEHMSYLSGMSYTDAVRNCLPEHLSEFAEIAQHIHLSEVLKTETIERSKANGLLNSLVATLQNITSDEEYDAAIDAAVARRA